MVKNLPSNAGSEGSIAGDRGPGTEIPRRQGTQPALHCSKDPVQPKKKSVTVLHKEAGAAHTLERREVSMSEAKAGMTHYLQISGVLTLRTEARVDSWIYDS